MKPELTGPRGNSDAFDYADFHSHAKVMLFIVR